MLEIIDRLPSEEYAEHLLKGFGQGDVVNTLLSLVLSESSPLASSDTNKGIILKVLNALLKRSADPELTLPPTAGIPLALQPPAVSAPNRLHSSRTSIMSSLLSRLPDILQALIHTNEPTPRPPAPLDTPEERGEVIASEPDVPPPPAPKTVQYPGHTVSSPFSSFRMNLVELLSLLIDSEVGEIVANNINTEHWSVLMYWLTAYPYNNIYHVLFYKIVYIVVR